MNLHPIPRRSFLSLPALWALLVTLCGLGACGGGGGGTGAVSPTQPTLQLLIGDAPIDELSAFSVVVDAVHLRRDDGSETANLIAAPRRVDLMSLVTRSDLLQVRSVEAGRYTGFRVAIDATSIDARDLTGAPVAIEVVSATTIAPFVTPVQVAAGTAVRLHLDIELERSLTASTGPSRYLLDLRASADDRSGAVQTLDEVHGQVLAVDAAARTLRIDLRRRDETVSFGQLTVRTSPSTAYFDDDAQSVNEAVFFAGAARPTARVEARGALATDGVFDATIIKVEDDSGGVSVGKIHGQILAIDTNQQVFTMQIRSIREGAALIGSVLSGLGSPSTIQVGYAAASVLRRSPAAAGSAADLRVGQRVEVRFSAFASEPFPARRIEIEDQRPEFEGTITDVSGLPSSIVMRLENHDPAVISGQVASSRTDVIVSLDGDERVWLQLGNEPTIAQNRIPRGVRARVRGTLSGTPQAPSIAAADLRLKPGRLEGTVAVGSAATRAFTVQWNDLDEPFGNGAPSANPVAASLGAGAVVRGDARSVDGMFSLLGGGRSISVRAFGITDDGGGIEIFEVIVDED